MRRSLVRYAILLAPILACGSGSAPPAQSDGGMGMRGIPVPGPGHAVDVAFQSVVPNDTPARATPLGTSTMNDVTVWVTNNAIGGASNASNYFVFRSGPSSGMFVFEGCFQAPLETMTATLWKVDASGSEQLPPVGTAASKPDGDASACLTFSETVLEANTVYLFGLTATGGAGEYSL